MTGWGFDVRPAELEDGAGPVGEAGTGAEEYGDALAGAVEAAGAGAGGGALSGAWSELAAARSGSDGTADAFQQASRTLVGNAESYREDDQRVARRLAGVEF
jgi:uncharacterized protein YukE